MATHAIGDRANRIALDTYERECDAAAAAAAAAAVTATTAATAATAAAAAAAAAAAGERSAGEEESAERAAAATDLRLRIEHFQIVDASDVRRVRRRGDVTNGTRRACLLASMQPTHATSDMSFARERLGEERLRGAYAWHSVLDAGAAALPFGSDWPTVGVVPPLLGVHAAVTRSDIHGSPIGGWIPREKVQT